MSPYIFLISLFVLGLDARRIRAPSDYADYDDSVQQQQQDSFQPQKGGVPEVRDENEEDIAAGGGEPNEPSDDTTHAPGMPYNFTYNVDENDTQFSQKVESDGEVVRGEYRVLLPDGRTQIVSYTADWKNGYNAKVTYEGQARPYVPAKRPTSPPFENEQDIQPGGAQPPCPQGFVRFQGETRCRRFQPPKTVLCPPNYVKSRLTGKCEPNPVDDNEKDIQSSGNAPPACSSNGKSGGNKACSSTRPCPEGNRNCRLPAEESEKDIQPGGYVPPEPKRCPAGYIKNPNGKCEAQPEENEKDIQPGGYVPPEPKRCPAGYIKKPNGKCQAPPEESEKDIQPGGYVPSEPKPCPPGYMRYPGEGHTNCHKLYSARSTRAPSQSVHKQPGQHEQHIQPGGTYPPTPPPCPPGQTYSPLNQRCQAKTRPSLMDQNVKCIKEEQDARRCFPQLCYPGSTNPGCQRRRIKPTSTTLPPPEDENEKDIQPGGSFPSICYPGSSNPGCQPYKIKPSSTTLPPPEDENEKDIQPGGFTPDDPPEPPKKPSNLYDAPDTPFGVRLNRKFGY